MVVSINTTLILITEMNEYKFKFCNIYMQYIQLYASEYLYIYVH